MCIAWDCYAGMDITSKLVVLDSHPNPITS